MTLLLTFGIGTLGCYRLVGKDEMSVCEYIIVLNQSYGHKMTLFVILLPR